MTNMCARCPRRDMANLFRALGDAAEADRIEKEGCVWWWQVEQTNDQGHRKIVSMCGAEQALPQFMTEFGAKIIEALGTAQNANNVIDQGLRGIATSMLARQALSKGQG